MTGVWTPWGDEQATRDWQAEALNWQRQVGELSDRIKMLEAENARLRARLDDCAAKALEIAGKYAEAVDRIVTRPTT